MKEAELRRVICGTGHRPSKLGGYGNDVTLRLINLAGEWLGGNRPEEVISGGALGWDQALAEAALIQGIPLVLALPFEDFDSKWPASSRTILARIKAHAVQVAYVCEPGYQPWKMQKRNEWMVDRADSVLALWDGSVGGTANCIKYANKVGKPITNLWEKYSERE